MSFRREIFIFISIILIFCEVRCENRSKVYFTNISFDPMKDDIAKPGFFNQEVVHFDSSNIKFLGRRIYQIFSSAKEIIFENCNLEFDSSDWLEKKFDVETLVFIGCKFSNDPPNSFEGLHHLQNITIQSCHFKGGRISEKFFGRSRSLKNLEISNSSITSLSRNAFAYLPNVESMKENRLNEDSTTNLFLRNVKLRYLNLESNKIYNIFSEFPTALEWLSLAENSLHPFMSCRYFQHLPNLKYLNMSSVGVELNMMKDCFQKYFISLETFDFSHNHFQHLQGHSISKIGTLKFVYLKNTNISDIHEGAFKGLNNLKCLDLSENNLENIDNDRFKDLKELSVLNLGGNRLKNIDKSLFEGLQNLESLNLTGNGIERSVDLNHVRIYL